MPPFCHDCTLAKFNGHEINMLAYKHTKTHHSLFKKRILDFDTLASEVGNVPALVVGFGEAATFGSAAHTNMYTYIYIYVCVHIPIHLMLGGGESWW